MKICLKLFLLSSFLRLRILHMKLRSPKKDRFNAQARGSPLKSIFQASGLDLDRFPRMAKKYSLLQFYFAFFKCSRKLKFYRFVVRNSRKIFVQIVLFVILLDSRFEVQISRNISKLRQRFAMAAFPEKIIIGTMTVYCLWVRSVEAFMMVHWTWPGNHCTYL